MPDVQVPALVDIRMGRSLLTVESVGMERHRLTLHLLQNQRGHSQSAIPPHPLLTCIRLSSQFHLYLCAELPLDAGQGLPKMERRESECLHLLLRIVFRTSDNYQIQEHSLLQAVQFGNSECKAVILG